MKSAQQIKSELEDLREVMESNHDMVFLYKGKRYFLSYGENEKGQTVRGFFEFPAAHIPIILFDDDKPESIQLDGKSLFDLIEEIQIEYIY